jgi:hypothetical protein
MLRWLQARSGARAPSKKRRPAFSPQVDGCESREMMSTLATPQGAALAARSSHHNTATAADLVFLDRLVQAAGVTLDQATYSDLVDDLNGKQSGRKHVAERVFKSYQYRANVAYGTLATLLGQEPTGAQVNGGANFLAKNTLEKYIANILASNQFYQQAGGTNADWLDSALGAAGVSNPSPGGYNNLLRALQSGQPRVKVAQQIAASNQSRAAVANQFTELFLGRPLQPGFETTNLVRIIAKGQKFALETALVTSAEFAPYTDVVY